MKRGVLGFLVVALIVPVFRVDAVSASSHTVVIKTVQTEGAKTSTATHELIEIENTSDVPVDITNWSLVYVSAAGSRQNPTSIIIEFTPPDVATRLYLGAHGSETVMSSEYVQSYLKDVDKTGLMTFGGKMSSTGGSVWLKNGAEIIDGVGWGTTTNGNFETAPVPAAGVAKLLRRTSIDTDDNSKDFAAVAQPQSEAVPSFKFTFGSIDEVEDFCANLPGIQSSVPVGLEPNAKGECVLPFVLAKLRITELLANPNGNDAGHEFIEIKNFETTQVDLADYMIRINDKTYGFPDGAKIEAESYKSFSDDDLGVSFANTTGLAVELWADDTKLDAMPGYMNAPIDMSWARFGEEWKYTNQMTPGAENLLSVEEGVDTDDGAVLFNQGCKEGYYRNELTGRCRKMPVTYQATPCKEGQYRSEETGRCRSIAQTVAASLKPCADDQFRNPDTGRCKKIASTDDLPEPCKPGYERNPETNRCRKQLMTTMPMASFPVEPIKQVAGQTGMWWTLGGILIATLGYGVWEWRVEIIRILRRALGIVSFGRR